MRKLTLILVSFLLITPVFKSIAQSENYDAVYLSITKEYTLNPDGSTDFRYAKSLKLQNYRSFNRLYGETFVVYNPDYQNLEINQAYTVMADGKTVIAPKNAFNEVLPGCAEHAPAFNRLREMVITHTGLEIGSTIFLDYRIHTEKGFYPAFMGSTLLAEEQPVNSMTVVIRTPADLPLYFHLFNAPGKPSETVENGFRVYRWVMKNIGATKIEKFQQDLPRIYPGLIFSSLSNYQALADFFGNQEAFRFQTNLAMNESVAELTLKNGEKSDLVFAIQESVVNDLNLFDIPEEYTGYQLRKPVDVWNSNGGTVAEKAVLMSSLLKQAGIPANPVIIFQGSRFDSKIGNLASMTEWAVQVETLELGTVYLSVKQVNAFDLIVLDEENVFMVLQDDKAVQLVYPERKEAVLSLTGIFVIDTALNFSGELNGTLSGSAFPFLALIRSEEKLKYYFRGGISSAKVTGVSFIEPTPGMTSFTCNLNKPNAMKKDPDFYYFALPYFSTGTSSWDIGQLPAHRETPVDPPSLIKESYNFTIAIPENMKVVSGEQEVLIKNGAGSFHFSVKQQGHTLQIRKEIEIDGMSGGTGDYAAFKELMDNLSIWKNNNLIFRN